MATKRWKRDKFHWSNFAYFEGDDGIGAFYDFIDANRGKEKDKIPVRIVHPSKKLRLLMKIK